MKLEEEADGVCLSDVFAKLMEVSKHVSNLEYDNKRVDLRRAKSTLRETREILKEFYDRVRKEVTTEVNTAAIEKNKNHKGNAHVLKTYHDEQEEDFN